MKKVRQTFIIILIFNLLAGCSNKRHQDRSEFDDIPEKIKIEAPFEMPDLSYPVIPSLTVSIVDFNARQDEGFKNTTAIKNTIDSCSRSGGGHVVIPPGVWLTGKIHLKSNINLHLMEGAELVFSDDPEDYLPAVKSSWEGMECFNYSPLIYAFECENISISGNGTIRAKLDTWSVWSHRPPSHMKALAELYNMASNNVPVIERQMAQGENNMRPQFIQFNRCKNILLEGFSIRQSPFWTIHLLLCDGAIIRGLDIYAHGNNNDGVDPEMTKNLLIENCTFDQGDDAIAIKAGRNQDAWRLNSPSENIVIRNCIIKEGHQMLALGSELSGGIRNVYFHDCDFQPQADAGLLNVLFIKTNERRGGFVENIYVENVKAGKLNAGILGIETDVFYQWKDLVPTYERRLTSISNIHMKNIEAEKTEVAFRISGNSEMPIRNIFLEDITVTGNIGKEFYKMINVKNVNMKDVKINHRNIQLNEHDFLLDTK